MTVVHSLSGVIYYFTKDSLTFAVLQGNLIREEIVVNVYFEIRKRKVFVSPT